LEGQNNDHSLGDNVDETDQQFLSAIARGDQAAFARVYHEWKDELLTVTVHLLSGDRSTAEDVVHDVFVTLARKAAEIEIQTSLKSYLITACLNRARDALRKTSRNETSPQEWNDWPSEEQTVSEIAASNEDRQRVLAAIQSLPLEQREVVTLKIHSQLTFREIAEVLEISSNTARSRYRYAVVKLKALLVTQESPQGEQT
jgi:RNA polymerase sigma-70 factor (ECF subfamily)